MGSLESPEAHHQPFRDPEEEHTIVSGIIRDFTRRYGFVTAVGGGLLRDEAGILWVPNDPSSVTSIFEQGLRRAEISADEPAA